MLPHGLARKLCEEGYDAVHPLFIGQCGMEDHQVLAMCINEDRILLTTNARHFLKLAGKESVHPGLILVEGGNLQDIEKQVRLSLSFVSGPQGEAVENFMMNR